MYVGTKGVSRNHLLSFDNNKVLKLSIGYAKHLFKVYRILIKVSFIEDSDWTKSKSKGILKLKAYEEIAPEESASEESAPEDTSSEARTSEASSSEAVHQKLLHQKR